MNTTGHIYGPEPKKLDMTLVAAMIALLRYRRIRELHTLSSLLTGNTARHKGDSSRQHTSLTKYSNYCISSASGSLREDLSRILILVSSDSVLEAHIEDIDGGHHPPSADRSFCQVTRERCRITKIPRN